MSTLLTAAALLSACAGDPFVFAASADAAPPDAGQDAPTQPNPVVLCPMQSCVGGQQQLRCCTSAKAPNASNCTGGTCGCDTELQCADESNCGLPQPICCIGQVMNDSACSGGHFVAQCQLACSAAETRLCDPNAPRCPVTRTCSTDASDLANVGLPAGEGYGVCK